MIVRLLLRLLSIDKRRIVLLGAGILVVITQTTSYGLNNTQQRTTLQDQFAAKLYSNDEEQRLDAVVQLGALFTSAPGTITDSTIAALTNSLLHDQSPVIRSLSARALELGGNADAVDPLLSALSKEKQVAVRKAIILALARFPSSKVTATLLPLLRDKNAEVRAAASHALAESNDPTATTALIEVLTNLRKDEDAFARSQAARGLGNLAIREALDPLVKALGKDKSQEVRRQAARALGNIATKQDINIIDALRKATLTSDPYLVTIAEHALEAINSRIE